MTITRTALKGPARAGDRLFDRFEREVSLAGLPPGLVDERPVTEDDLIGLPPAARRYFGFMGVIGRPRDWSFRARFVGRFRLNPKLGWMPAEAWQYNSAISIGRVFVMRILLRQGGPHDRRRHLPRRSRQDARKALGDSSPSPTAKARSSTSAS